ncbi:MULTISPECIES: phosphonate ABC transporter, permease protein PhnE [unclassified Nitrospina]|uniref:phosphonate ABC transporter, permease protein PhnE n=1 Tax=unclassified Nitrospina TaxID=2638683 RepID=UPI003F962072
MASMPTSPPHRPFYTRTKFFVYLFFAVVVYAYGWRVTEIHPSSLVKDFHLVKPLVTALLQPDLVTFETDRQTTEAGFFLQEATVSESAITPPGTEDPVLKITRTRGQIGDTLTARGFHLAPERTGKLYWVNAIEQEYPLGEVTTDAGGGFEKQITVPPTARGNPQYVRVVLTWETGEWHLSETLKLTADKIVETLFLGLMATTFALLFAAPLSFLGARNLMTRRATGTTVYYLVRTGFNVLRAIEPLIMAILFAVWVGIGPFAGVLALALHSTAALGKLFSEQIESIDPGPVEAITATGARPLQVVLYGVLPQVLPQFLALGFYRWDINVRMSTIIGFVGGGGIGFLLQQWINLLQYNQAGTALLAIAVVVIALDMVSAKVRERITLAS